MERDEIIQKLKAYLCGNSRIEKLLIKNGHWFGSDVALFPTDDELEGPIEAVDDEDDIFFTIDEVEEIEIIEY